MLPANNTTNLEPNVVLYLDEKPPKIILNKRAAKSKKSPKKAVEKKTISKAKKTPAKQTRSKVAKGLKVKKEFNLSLDQDVKKLENMDPNDPLYTPQVEIKFEPNEEKMEKDEEDQEDFIFNTDSESDYQNDDLDDDEDEDDDDDEFEKKPKKNKKLTDEDEDEPLIKLTTRKKSRKQIKEEAEDKIKAPRKVQCRLICKQHCNEKFTEEQRQRMCDYYWNLNKDERLTFIRKHIKSKRLIRMKSVKGSKRGNNCCYYFKDYTKKEDTAEESSPQSSPSSSDLIRVCRKYFEATLCITNHYIKKAIKGYDLEVEQDTQILTEMIKAYKESKTQENTKEIKQILDPETGNLITIDPNDKKAKTKTSSEEKPKKKAARRRPGDPVPEHFPKPIKCAQRCIYKCHMQFSEEERKQICDIFWSMDYKRRKDYVLEHMEIKEILTQTTPEFRRSNRPPRSYHTRFFLRNGMHGENKRVCKHFLTQTLCTNRTFIGNALEFADKTTGYYTGEDRRGLHPPGNIISAERKQVILDHINTYPTWIPNKKSKSKYLHSSLTIKQMYEDYKTKCAGTDQKPVSIHNYTKFFHQDFRLAFLANREPKKGHGLLKKNPNISHYTGEEPGGFWIDPNGEKLDLRLFNPAQCMTSIQQQQSQFKQQPSQLNSSTLSNSSQDSTSNIVQPSTSSLHLNYASAAAVAAAHQLATFVDNSTNPRAICPTSSLVRLDLNQSIYDSLPHSTSSMFRML